MISFHASVSCLPPKARGNEDWTPFPSPPCAIPLSLSEVPQRGTETGGLGQAAHTQEGWVVLLSSSRSKTPFAQLLEGKDGVELAWLPACCRWWF